MKKKVQNVDIVSHCLSQFQVAQVDLEFDISIVVV